MNFAILMHECYIFFPLNFFFFSAQLTPRIALLECPQEWNLWPKYISACFSVEITLRNNCNYKVPMNFLSQPS